MPQNIFLHNTFTYSFFSITLAHIITFLLYIIYGSCLFPFCIIPSYQFLNTIHCTKAQRQPMPNGIFKVNPTSITEYETPRKNESSRYVKHMNYFQFHTNAPKGSNMYYFFLSVLGYKPTCIQILINFPETQVQFSVTGPRLGLVYIYKGPTLFFHTLCRGEIIGINTPICCVRSPLYQIKSKIEAHISLLRKKK